MQLHGMSSKAHDCRDKQKQQHMLAFLRTKFQRDTDWNDDRWFVPAASSEEEQSGRLRFYSKWFQYITNQWTAIERRRESNPVQELEGLSDRSATTPQHPVIMHPFSVSEVPTSEITGSHAIETGGKELVKNEPTENPDHHDTITVRNSSVSPSPALPLAAKSSLAISNPVIPADLYFVVNISALQVPQDNTDEQEHIHVGQVTDPLNNDDIMNLSGEGMKDAVLRFLKESKNIPGATIFNWQRDQWRMQCLEPEVKQDLNLFKTSHLQKCVRILVSQNPGIKDINIILQPTRATSDPAVIQPAEKKRIHPETIDISDDEDDISNSTRLPDKKPKLSAPEQSQPWSQLRRSTRTRDK